MLRLRFAWLVLIAVLLAGVVGTPSRANPTAQLAEAHKLMQNGAYVRAIEVIDATLSRGGLSSDMNGRALLMRAQSNEKLGKAAFALADYNQALWMEGLPAAEKRAAEEGRKRVEGKLGMNASEAGDGDSAHTQRAAAAPRGATRQQAAQQQQKEESGGGFFDSIFGSSKKEDEPQPTAAATERSSSSRSVKTVRASTTNTAASPVPVKVATAKTAVPANAGPADFAIQFAALLSEESAIAEVNRIAKRFGPDLGGRSPSVVIVPTKDGGTLYKIVAGPYPKAEGVATCEMLKAKNVNCMIISHKQP